jgi:Ca2+-binding RTX toxin-like protein
MTNIVHISANAGPDLAAIINAALADPNVSTVILEPGLFLIDSPIFVPSDKTLMGSGREDTIIRASQGFTFPNVQNNAVIMSVENSSGITLSDFTVDAAKVSPGGLRLNGIFMRFSADFDIARIDVMNATGYANYAVGDLGTQLPDGTWVHGTPASGRYEDVNTFNSQVHFEQFFADGITLSNVHARDGDGDISTEAYFHPIVGSRNITYENSSAIGRGFLGFSLISSVLPLENIQIINTQIEIMDPSTGSALISLGGLPVNGLYIQDSSFIAYNYIAFRIGGVTGTATNSYFQGGFFGLEVTTSGNGTPSDFDVTDSEALAVRDGTSGAGVAGVHSDQASYLSWTGGSIEARGGLNFPISGAATISPTTQLIGTGHDIITSFVEHGEDIAFLASENFDLSGTPNLNGATLLVRYLSHRSEADLLYVAAGGMISVNGTDLLYGGNIIAAISGGDAATPLLITFNAAATPAMAEAVLDAVTFANDSETPLTNARLISAGLQIIGGDYTEITASLSVIADADAIGVADNGATVESATVLIDVLANDIDPDARHDRITMIDNVAIASGETVTLASGALVKLTVDGQLLYDPNGVFDALAAPSSGTHFTSAADSFTYALSGGGSAQVEVLLTGETSSEDILLGDAGTNNIHAVLAGQTVRALDGADSLFDDGLAVTLEGGTDSDVYQVGNAGTMILELVGEGIDTVNTTLGSFTLPAHFENLLYTGTGARFYGYGNAQNNILQGGALGDFLLGYTGSDILRGGGGADVLNGGADHDTLDGGTGADVLIGGGGNDIFIVDHIGDNIIEGSDPGYDSVFTSLSSYTLTTWVENLSFSGTGAYHGTGNAVSNQMQGSVNGDTLLGLGGNDRLIGFGGNDILHGGDGDDLLQGGIGSDQLTGGSGADRFRFDTTISTGNVDHIQDFESGIDRIELARAIFGALELGSLSASAFIIGTQAQNANHRLIYDPESGALYYDADGDGALAQVQIASLAPQTTLNASDFVII